MHPFLATPIAGGNGVQQACLYETDVLLHRVRAANEAATVFA